MEAMAVVNAGHSVVKARAFADLRNKLAKNSPEILVGVGVAGVLVSTVLACRSTLKAPALLEAHKENLKAIEDVTENEEICYSDEDRRNDLLITYSKTGWEFVKIYAVPAAIMAGSLFCIFKGHGITMKRNAGLSAAVGALTTGYNAYRERVKEEVGAEKEADIYYGRKTETVTEEVTDAKGKVKTVKKEVTTYANPNAPSVYARYFDEGSTEWKPIPELNRAFLSAQQRMANDKLHMNRVLLLNDVYDMLGLSRTADGCVMGWVMQDDGDNYVDFGIFDRATECNTLSGEAARAFINGDEPSVLLDFNIDGEVMKYV